MAEQRLIDANKLFTEFENAAWYNNADRDDVAEELLLNAPTVDSAPVRRGHWIKYEVDVAEHPWHCSYCGWTPPKYVCHIGDMEYCSHCGARMDEEVQK